MKVTPLEVCGRWRNGNPLELEPDAPGKTLHLSKINDFTYVSTDAAQSSHVQLPAATRSPSLNT